MGKRIIASSLRNVPHLAILDDLIAARMAGIDRSAVFVYLADIVNADALYWLAKHFDVLGYKGWALATTDEQRRELIKQAITLHKTAGTPYSIERAIESVGYTNVTILERINVGGIYYDGTHSYNGSSQYGDTHWTRFRVIVEAAGIGPIDAATSDLLVELINIYKPTRSHLLDGITYSLAFEDNLGLSDTFALIQGAIFEDSLYQGPGYDGTIPYDGTTQHQSDIFFVEVV